MLQSARLAQKEKRTDYAVLLDISAGPLRMASNVDAGRKEGSENRPLAGVHIGDGDAGTKKGEPFGSPFWWQFVLAAQAGMPAPHEERS